MKKYILVLTFVLIAALGFSQTNAAPGTYQLMTTNVKEQEVFTTEVLQLIESKREVTKTVVIKIGTHTWARILSVNTINATNFVPLPEGIIGIDPSDTILEDIDLNNSNN